MVFSKPFPFLGIVLVAFWLSAGLVETEAAGECVHAWIPEPMVLPDGDLHPAGSLRICLDSKLTPVAGVHATWVNGQPAGRFVSRVGAPEDLRGFEDAFLRFGRTGAGTLVLEAYAVPAGKGWRTYALSEPAPRRSGAGALVARAPASVVILAAARAEHRER